MKNILYFGICWMLSTATALANCPDVTGLLATTVSATEVQLSWDAMPGATKYLLEVESEEGTTPFVLSTSLTDSAYLLEGLVSGGIYKFKVRTICGGDKANWSAFLFFTLDGGSGGGGGGTGGACDTPTGLTVSDITSSSALISWNAVAGAQGYEVEVEDDENTPAFQWNVIVTDTSVTVTGLSPNGNYQVKVKTKCDGGINSADSDWVFFSATNLTGTASLADLTPNPGSSIQAYLSPNPAYGGEDIYLELKNTPATGTVWVMVYDLQGRMYKTVEAQCSGLEAIPIPTNGLQPGMYQVVIRAGNDVQSRRFSLLD